MPALANLSINDGLATPVAHTFNPVGIDKNEVATFEDKVGGVPLGFGRISTSLRRPTSGGLQPGSNSSKSVYRARLKIDVPVLEVTSPSTGSGIQPAPTVAYTAVANVEFVIPARCSLQDRKDILAFMKNLLADNHATNLVVNLESVW